MGLIIMDGLVSFWNFKDPERGGFRAVGPGNYLLRPRPSFPEIVPDGVFGPHSVRLKPGYWLECPRMQCPMLNISGQPCGVTVVAWLRWNQVSHCQFVAGMWDETNRSRQYGLFLNLNRRYSSAHNAHGHVSAEGGPTQGERCCITYSTGATELEVGQWYTLAMTYDGEYSRVFVNGKLDTNPVEDKRFGPLNPFRYADGLYDGGMRGADFTVGAVDSSGKMNNWFDGDLAGIAVFNRALIESEIAHLHRTPSTGANVTPSTQYPSITTVFG